MLRIFPDVSIINRDDFILKVRECYKDADKAAAIEKREAEDAARREQNLEEAKKIVIAEDPSLPKAMVKDDPLFL